jgi:hypothetical protein
MQPTSIASDAERPLTDQALVALATALAQHGSTCLWWGVDTQAITSVGAAREVARHVRQHGGRAGWLAAAQVVRCL